MNSMVRYVYILFVFLLYACGGGGTNTSNQGGGGRSSSSSSGSALPDQVVSSTSSSGGGSSGFEGVGSYRNFTVNYDPLQPRQYTFTMTIDGTDDAFNASELSGLATSSQSFQARDSNFTLGTQNYQLLSLNCSYPNTQNSYDAILLFDRSGSMQGNDPSDQSRAAGQVFVDNLGVSDRAGVYQFQGQFQVADALSGLTGNPIELGNAIDNLRLFGGDTPLWDAMNASLNELRGSPQNKALLVFSDGQDTASSTHSARDIESRAQLDNIAVYAINLRNSNSYNLDEIALATGGNIFSTDDAADLIAYYGFLGKILSGTSVQCHSSIRVTFTPVASVNGAVGFGPATGTKTDFTFNAATGSRQGTVTTKVHLPLYAGRQVGTTLSGTAVYETDLYTLNNNTASACVATGAQLSNRCSHNAIYVAACNTSTCTRGVLTPGGSLTVPPGADKYYSCWWLDGYNQYIPSVISGSAPNQIYREVENSLQQYRCVYAARFDL